MGKFNKRSNSIFPLAAINAAGLPTGNEDAAELSLDNDGNLRTSAAVTLNPGDINIGSVQIRDGDDADEARVVAPAALTEAMVVVGVHDFVNGATADAAIVTDANGTLSGKLRGLVKWAYERMPAALGGTVAANSLPVVLSSDGPFALQTGSITETAPATDTASSGLNGRLQRIAQRLTSLIALLPASIGQKLISTSLAVVFPSDATGASAMQAQGATAHDSVDAGNPVKTGAVAVAFNGLPAVVAAGDRTNLYATISGIPFVLCGYPGPFSFEYSTTSAGTDVAMMSVGGTEKLIVTLIQATLDNAATVDVGFRVGYGATTTPATGNGILLTHPGMAPGESLSRGSGSGVIGAGALGEDIRITNEVPTTGALRILITGFTITG